MMHPEHQPNRPQLRPLAHHFNISAYQENNTFSVLEHKLKFHYSVTLQLVFKNVVHLNAGK